MTETVTASPATASFIASGLEMLNAQIQAANALAERGEKVANSTKVIADLRDDENTEDAKIKAFQRWFDKANDEILKRQKDIENYIRSEKLQEEGVEPIDIEKDSIQYKALNDTIKATRSLITQLNGGAAPDGIADLKSFPGVRKTGSGGGQSGIKRPRFKSVQYRLAGSDTWNMAETDKRDAKGTVVGKASNLSALALAINKVEKSKLTASDIQRPLFDVIGENTELSTLADKEITFVVSVGTKNYEVQVIPAAAD